MKSTRRYSAIDGILIGFDDFLHALNAENRPNSRNNPAAQVQDSGLTAEMAKKSAALMRVNHAGEVAAQALYQGQGLTARDPGVKESMQKSAQEEIDHLVWCQQRLDELGSHSSYLNPVWYLGSFSIGAVAGVCGDKWSLGFVAETERQVVTHLQSHLARLPQADHKSRAILEQMQQDESHHATVAEESGAADLPEPVKKLMSLCSGVMTKTAYWI